MSVPAGADPLGLRGRTAVVTGGARGIGARVVARLADAGVRGAVLDADPAADPPDGWTAITMDVREEASVRAALAEVGQLFPRLDGLVAAAGVVPGWASVQDLTFAAWDDVLAVNARGVAATLAAAVPHLVEGSAVVAVASLNGWRGDPRLLGYVASKHAVVGVVRAAALELGPAGIRVNAVAPGPVATDALLGRMAKRARGGGAAVATALEDAAAQTALRRIATADEVASAVLYLLSPLSSGTTGHLLPVDGGIA